MQVPYYKASNFHISKSLTLNSDGTLSLGVCTLKMMSTTTMMTIARMTQKSLRNCFTCKQSQGIQVYRLENETIVTAHYRVTTEQDPIKNCC